MALRGDLASVDLAQVFQMLAMNQKVGLLSIQSKRLWKVLHFDQRGVTMHHNEHAVMDRVVAGFVRLGRLREDALEEVQDHAARMGQPLVDSLLAGGYLDAAELEERYRFELEEELYDLFFCRDARFEFHENAATLEGFDGKTDDRFLFNCDSIVMEAARRIDEWAYIVERVPADDEVYLAQVDSIATDEIGDDGAAVFELLDGRRTIARLIELTGQSRFQVFKTLSILLDSGAIAPAHEDDLVDFGVECLEEGRLEEAASLFERAAALGVGLPDVHGLAANAYTQAEKFGDAARHLEAEADCLLDQNEPNKAARKLLELRQMLPTSLSAREKLADIALDHNLSLPDFDALAEGKEIVELLLAFGDVERVRALLERLLVVVPDDLDLKKALISVHIKAGDQQRVAELYEAIAEDLVEAGQPLEAVGYLQKILLMDRSRTDISARVRELYECDERARRRMRILGALACLFCVLVIGGAFYWFYNERAKQEFEKIDVRELVAHQDFAGAAIAYRDFVNQFPFTSVVGQAENELKRIEAEQKKFDAKLAAERAERQREIDRLRREYKKGWKLHREQFLDGAPAEAIETLRKVREQLEAAGAAEDVAWALENEVERHWQRLQDYVNNANELAVQYNKALEGGDWQLAREHALHLKDKYENTEANRKVHVPVMIRTQPPGAKLMHRGKPLTQNVDGETEPLVTPTLIYCADALTPVELTTELEGFESSTITVQPIKDGEVAVVLTVVPARRLDFPVPLQSGITSAGGWLAVGLRSGKLGIARTDGSGQRVFDLPGLKELSSAPQISTNRLYFVSNENTIECLSLTTAKPVAGWPAALPNGAATELVVGGGRLAVIDGAYVVHCWEQGRGSHLWSVSLDSAPAGPPTMAGRNLLVGTNDGRVLNIDVTNGRIRNVLRTRESLSTRPLTDGKIVVFGCSSGLVRAIELETGRVLWDQQLPAKVVDGTLMLASGHVACAHGRELVVWNRDTGTEAGRRDLGAEVQPGMGLQGDQLLVRVRRKKEGRRRTRDVLVAVDVASANVLWEYESETVSPGAFGVDSMSIAFPGAENQVVLFR